MAGQRGGLAAHAFHQVAIAADAVNVVGEDLEARTVEMRFLPLCGDRHADTVADALAERPGGGFNTGRQSVLGMAGGSAVQLAKLLYVVERHGEFAEAFVLRTYSTDAG